MFYFASLTLCVIHCFRVVDVALQYIPRCRHLVIGVTIAANVVVVVVVVVAAVVVADVIKVSAVVVVFVLDLNCISSIFCCCWFE